VVRRYREVLKRVEGDVREKVEEFLRDEEEHERVLLSQIDEPLLRYIGFIMSSKDQDLLARIEKLEGEISRLSTRIERLESELREVRLELEDILSRIEELERR
jgi:chromosome segregation ATPase